MMWCDVDVGADESGGVRVALVTQDMAMGEAFAFLGPRHGLVIEIMDLDDPEGVVASKEADVLVLDSRRAALAGNVVGRLAAGVRRVVMLGAPEDAYPAARPDVWVSFDADFDDLVAAVTSTERTRLSVGVTLERDRDALTPREREVVQLLLAGLSVEAMGAELGISANTVRTHLQNTFSKLRVNGRAEVAAWALRAGIRPANLETEVGT